MNNYMKMFRNWNVMEESTCSMTIKCPTCEDEWCKECGPLIANHICPSLWSQNEWQYLHKQSKDKKHSCRCCNKLDVTGKIISSKTGNKYDTVKDVTCKSKNLIYCITCENRKCGKQYVGQTTQELGKRFNHHFHCILSDNENTTRLYVHEHFRSHFTGKNISDEEKIQYLQIHVLEKADGRDLSGLEREWIGRLKTLKEDGGLNEKK